MSSKFLELSALPAAAANTSQEIGQFFPLELHSNRHRCERKREGLLNNTAYSLNVFPLVLLCPTSSLANKQMKERNSGYS
jgi:hypothetical protein